MNSNLSTTRWPLLIHDQTRLEYTRLLWKRPRSRARLLRHWADARHPYAERFKPLQSTVERVLAAGAEEDDLLDAALQKEGLSLRVIVREIPPVFGSFY